MTVPWLASRLAAAQTAVVACEAVTGHMFTVSLRGWEMKISVRCPWWAVWWVRWRVGRAARSAVGRMNVPIKVVTVWERPQ